MVKDQVKECWHENVTQCHDTYVTEFLPSQEQKCEETFWKSCKIDFKEAPYNYTMKSCHTPLKKECDPPSFNGNVNEAEIVCKTWFESECNTTFVQRAPDKDDLPNTWCKKVPRKICAPDNCRMVPGIEECNLKMMVSTIQQPSEVCDLQPQTHCRLITRLVPHLLQKEVCRNVPKEMCHLSLANPHMVRKPLKLRWCTKNPPEGANLPQQAPPPSYKPSYLPPPPRPAQQRINSNSIPPAPTYTPTFNPPPPPPVQGGPDFSRTPTFSIPSPTNRPALQFQRRSQTETFETKFKPLTSSTASKLEQVHHHPSQPLDQSSPSNVLIEELFVQNSEEDRELIEATANRATASPLVEQNRFRPRQQSQPQPEVVKPNVIEAAEVKEEADLPIQPIYREVFRPLVPKLSKPSTPSIQMPPAPISISDELSGLENFGATAGVLGSIGDVGLKKRK